MIRAMDDDLPRPKGDAAALLGREDLSPYSQDELAERISLLEAEIVRGMKLMGVTRIDQLNRENLRFR